MNKTEVAHRKHPKLHPFTGLVSCGHCEGAMVLAHTVKHGNKRYGYYICNEDIKRNISICPTPRVPAAEFEHLVLRELEVVLKTPTMLARVDSRLDAVCKDKTMREEMARKAVRNLCKLWEVMIPTERYQLIHNIVKKIRIYADHVQIEFNQEGLVKLLTEAGVTEHGQN